MKMKNKLVLTLLAMIIISLNAFAYNTDIPVAVKDSLSHTVAVDGDLGAAYKNSNITLMLLKNSADTENIQPSDILNIHQFKTDEYGSYTYRFSYKGDISDCRLYINQAGYNIARSIKSASATMDMYKISSDVDTYNGRYDISIKIKDLFLSEGSFKCMTAFYTDDNRLIALNYGDKRMLSDYVDYDNLSGNIPSNAKEMKLFIWNDTKEQLPISKALERSTASPYDAYINYRGALNNTYKKLTEDKNLKIGFIGGSVTNGAQLGDAQKQEASWRRRVTRFIQSEFPDAYVTDINAAIGGTGSKLGMFRIDRDLLEKDVDLVFIEFAINDWYNNDSTEDLAIQYETLIRKVYKANPNAEIISLYVTDSTVGKNQPPYFKTAKIQNDIAEYYDITSVNMGRSLADYIYNNDFLWSDYFFDNVHPSIAGHDYYFNVLKEMLTGALISLEGAAVTQRIEKEPVSAKIPINAKSIYPSDIAGEFSGWQKGSWFMTSYTPGSKFTVPFSGTMVGIYKEAGKGGVEYSIDGGEFVYLSFEKGKTINPPDILAKNLSDTNHTITFKAVAGDDGCELNIRSILAEK